MTRSTMGQQLHRAPWYPPGMHELIQNQFLNDRPMNDAMHWSYYQPTQIKDFWVAQGIGNPPNLRYVQGASDPAAAKFAAERRAGVRSVLDQASVGVIRSREPMMPPEPVIPTSPLSPSTYNFGREVPATIETLHNSVPMPSSSDLFSISKDTLIQILAFGCGVLLLIVFLLVQQKK